MSGPITHRHNQPPHSEHAESKTASEQPDSPRGHARSASGSPHPYHERVLSVLKALPRHVVVPEARGVAEDRPVSLGAGRIVPPVEVVEKMLAALELEGGERVLEVGGGAGFQAALLSRLAHEVVSLEINQELAERAASELTRLGCDNVLMIHADGFNGWPAAAPYQAIVVAAAAPELPSALVEQLDVGGRLVIALGDETGQLIERFHKRVDGLESEVLGACRLDLLDMPQRPPSSYPWTRHE